jgi:hypothetical protein
MGSGTGNSGKFASNLFTLVAKYIGLVFKGSRNGAFASAALVVGIYSAYATVQVLYQSITQKEE